jgi:NAD(P)-dependent dehydrogenase (short-subunit alcohol dehydrogenase family)
MPVFGVERQLERELRQRRSAATMNDHTLLLTGGTSGIGWETARALAPRGGVLILAGRSPTRVEDACAILRAESGNANVYPMVVDLASLRSVRQCAAELLVRSSSLHVLINNAGTFCLSREETEGGFERTLATNYLGPFLLTASLAPLLAATPGARVINVSSDAYRYGRLALDDLALERGYGGFPAYARSKLAVQLWTQELAERLRPWGVTANTLHPGHVATNIWRLWPRPTKVQALLIKLLTAWMRSPRAGATTSVYLATSPAVAGVTGAYFVGERARPVARRACNPALQRQLWELSERLTGIVWPLPPAMRATVAAGA